MATDDDKQLFDGLDFYDPTEVASEALAENPFLNASDTIDISEEKYQCLASLETLNKKPLLAFLESKFETFEPVNDVGCSSLLNQNSELLPILIVNSIPVVGNVRFPGIYPIGRGVNGRNIFNLAGGFLYESLTSETSFEVGTKLDGFNNYSFSELLNLSQITFFNPRLEFSNIYGEYKENYK